MAASEWYVFDQALVKLLQGKIRLGVGGSPEDTVSVILVGDAQAIDTDFAGASGLAVYSDITDELANGDGYTTGGEAATNVVVTLEAASPENYAKVDFDDIVWTSLTKTGIYAAIVVVGEDLFCFSYANPSASPPTIDVPGVNLTLQIAAGGVVQMLRGTPVA